MELAKAVYNMKWYNWNIECQKTYLLVIVNLSDGTKIPIDFLGFVGHDLLKNASAKIIKFGTVILIDLEYNYLQTTRFVYTLAGCFYSLRKKG